MYLRYNKIIKKHKYSDKDSENTTIITEQFSMYIQSQDLTFGGCYEKPMAADHQL